MRIDMKRRHLSSCIFALVVVLLLGIPVQARSAYASEAALNSRLAAVVSEAAVDSQSASSGKKVGWVTTRKGNRYYYDSNGKKLKNGWHTIDGTKYLFDENGKLLTNTWYKRQYADAEGKKLPRTTLLKFLQTALQPVGKTMYIWGGGWNEEDTGSGAEAVSIGVAPAWEQFFRQQDSAYNYQNTRYQIHNGLDCSGYVGWTIYNAFNSESGHSGYVMKADKMAQTFAVDYGWGTYTPAASVRDYRAGDIMSSSGHVYIVAGQCEDGSVVLMHASPPGVMISGTTTRGGSYGSQAISLARQYMKTYYPDWYAKFPDSSRGTYYLTSFSRMRWRLGGNCLMKDPEGLRKKSAGDVLRVLFGEAQ